MGNHPNIAIDCFPAQGAWNGKVTDVCFDYDTSKTVSGVIVRDDSDESGFGVILLEDGRVVRTTECQHRPARLTDKEHNYIASHIVIRFMDARGWVPLDMAARTCNALADR
jgi:hypothetical protein